MTAHESAPKWESYWEFREWLLGRLNERGWIPLDLARRMNPKAPANTASSVSKWLRGVRRPDPESCRQLADMLGDDVDFVLELAGHRPRASSNDDDATAEARAIIAMLARLPAEKRRDFRRMIRAIYDDIPGEGPNHPNESRRDDRAAAVAVLARGLDRAPAHWS